MNYETDISGKWVPIKEAERLCELVKMQQEKISKLIKYQIYYENLMDKYED
jgi:hypothetical protein